MDDEPPSLVPSEMLARVKNANEEACDQLVEALYPLVSRRISNHIRRSADHEDVIQEVFIKVFLKIEQFKGSSPFEHWVSRIAVTTCYDWLRKRRARPLFSYADLTEQEAELVERTLSGSLDGEDTRHQVAVRDLLDKLIGRLKPREQIVVRLMDLQGHTVREIEELTGWKPSRIKTLAMRARRKLAQELGKIEGSKN